MTPEQVKQMMPVIQAFAEGKPVEIFNSRPKKWVPADNLSFTSAPENYRIRPEPKKLWAVVCNETKNIIYSNKDKTVVTEYYNKQWSSNHITNDYTYSLEEYIQVV